MKVLAGDIGGTKTLLQIAEVQEARHTVLHQQKFASQSYGDFDALLNEFLSQAPTGARQDLQHACFGVAGPLSGSEHGARQARITNLPWRMDSAALQSAHRLQRVRLINDFHAIAAGIDALGADDLASLNTAPEQGRAPRLVVGAGTGLGVAQLMWSEGRYRVYASEGGHIHFAPCDAAQRNLLAYLQQEFERVSYERVVSGPGLVRIHRFHAQRDGLAEAALTAILSSADPAAVIAAAAQRGDALSLETIRLFLSIYGAVAGDLALLSLAYGGVYLAGGIAPKLMRAFGMDEFMLSYGRKGRMSDLVKAMPVRVILNEEVGLLGAALVAAEVA